MSRLLYNVDTHIFLRTSQNTPHPDTIHPLVPPRYKKLIKTNLFDMRGINIALSCFIPPSIIFESLACSPNLAMRKNNRWENHVDVSEDS
ncbi:hypothetical protein CDAR_216331 [Caerostris darwini]|uniref:Uncharacterized protein n=1 Tax=Caerostris darwini TaxID=1538125 RepID=A0AAV4STT4_9ARAC|nr:hypothetical protein CDAR_216331 [Caerostris darwini]